MMRRAGLCWKWRKCGRQRESQKRVVRNSPANKPMVDCQNTFNAFAINSGQMTELRRNCFGKSTKFQLLKIGEETDL